MNDSSVRPNPEYKTPIKEVRLPFLDDTNRNSALNIKSIQVRPLFFQSFPLTFTTLLRITGPMRSAFTFIFPSLIACLLPAVSSSNPSFFSLSKRGDRRLSPPQVIVKRQYHIRRDLIDVCASLDVGVFLPLPPITNPLNATAGLCLCLKVSLPSLLASLSHARILRISISFSSPISA